MLNWLIYYFIFVAFVSLIIAFMIFKLKVAAPVRLLCLIFLLIISPVLLSYIVAAYLNPLPETMVPDLTGKTFEEASEIVQSLDLNIKIEAQAGESRVISNQRPEGGRIVKIGRTIYVTLGEKMPDLPGSSATFEGEVEETYE